MTPPLPSAAAHFRGASGTPPPNREQKSVGAGHARPAALPLPPIIFYIVGRGLDPYAAFRRRSPPQGVGDAAPYSGNP